MGIFNRKAKPAFAPPELPMSNVPNHRRASVMDNLRALSFSGPSSSTASALDPFTHKQSHDGMQQSSFLGRKFSQTLVPAFARKASLAVAERDKNATHMRMGETDTGAEDDMRGTFYNTRLTIDETSDEEYEEKAVMKRKVKGKAKAVDGGWQTKLGWDVGPPQGKANKVAREKQKRKHRQRRVIRELDKNLDAFNTYSQNGQTPSSRSLEGSRNASFTSLPASLHQNPEVAKSLLDNDSLFLPDDRPRVVLVGDGYDALDVMADHIFRLGVQTKKWFKAPRMGSKRSEPGTGVSLRAKTGLYRTFPVNYEAMEEFEEAVARLNPEVAIKIDSEIVRNIMTTYIDPAPSMFELTIDANTRIQILDEMIHLARAKKHQYAAFIRSEGILCVWADHVEAVIPAAEALEDSLVQFIWRGEEENRKINQALRIDAEMADKERAETDSIVHIDDPEDIVKLKIKRQWRERPVNILAPLLDGCAIMTCIALISLGLRTLIVEYLLDGQMLRFVLFIFAMPFFWIALFACMCLVSGFFQTLGPVRHVTENSRYLSGIAPKRTMGELAHVTVQMPVYKEGLEDVIMPTVESLKKAITTYERQGGSVSILMCDDGLQLLPASEVAKRKAFYFDNNIAYVARPGHNVDGFIRKGRFKKAGNMNFANDISLSVEAVMDELRPAAQEAKADPEQMWSKSDENAVYDLALARVLEEKPIAWAAGDVRIGQFILIIDSDTRVPEDCFADAVSEMAESPDVAIIQHVSGVMQVANHFFENGIAHFTRGIQVAISYCCASGETAPFVGHNAFVRWSALQECLDDPDPDDGVRKIWSESHVSEDFQISLKLQARGYTIRWAAYTKGEFEEGVSLTCDDELNRWQKYSFGCSELIFNSFRYWFTRSPFTPLFREFLWSPIALHSKFTVMGYMFSYYAIACAWPFTFANYFIVGFNLPVDGYYLPSWKVFVFCVVLFMGLCNVSFIVLRYRLKLPDCGRDAVNTFVWLPFFSIFFTGMSMPMSAALISHMVGYNMTWSSTIKTVEKSNFFLQLPLIWKRFWPQLSFFGLCAVGMFISSSSLMPTGYRINNIEVFVPMGVVTASHILWPFALNPWFLSFSF